MPYFRGHSWTELTREERFKAGERPRSHVY
jgi:hypothetical protein